MNAEYELSQLEGYLFHGSRMLFGNVINPGRDGFVYATNNPAIAIMKAVYSNVNCINLGYPNFISKKNPLELHIKGINDNTIGEYGWVYLIKLDNSNINDFVNEPIGSWQFKTTKKVNACSIKKVYKKDFTYPVYDDDNKIRLQ